MSDLFVCRGCMESVECSKYTELNLENRELYQLCTHLKVCPEFIRFYLFTQNYFTNTSDKSKRRSTEVHL